MCRLLLNFQVSVEQSDGRELLLHKLGYSPTQYSLYLIPNSALWAGLTLSNLTKLSTSTHANIHENIGTLLFDHGRHFSLVLATKSKKLRDNDVISEGEEYSTPKQCDTLLHDVGESGYSTFHSSIATSTPLPPSAANDVIITSASQTKPTDQHSKLNESCSTIIVSDSEDDEDPLHVTPRASTLPGLHTHTYRSHQQSIENDSKSISQPTNGLYFLPPRPPHLKHSFPVTSDSNNSRSGIYMYM